VCAAPSQHTTNCFPDRFKARQIIFGWGNVLGASLASLQETLKALQTGGAVRYPADEFVQGPAAGDVQILEQMRRVEQLWEAYRPNLETVLSASSDETDSSGSRSCSFAALW
jgi:hypothetical protein